MANPSLTKNQLDEIQLGLSSNFLSAQYLTSAATIWEISIKTKLGKLKITDNYIEELKQEGFFELAINLIVK